MNFNRNAVTEGRQKRVSYDVKGLESSSKPSFFSHKRGCMLKELASSDLLLQIIAWGSKARNLEQAAKPVVYLTVDEADVRTILTYINN